jgi:hypothetical protein
MLPPSSADHGIKYRLLLGVLVAPFLPQMIFMVVKGDRDIKHAI